MVARYRVMERRFYDYSPTGGGIRKSTLVMLDMPDSRRVRGNMGDYRVWVFPNRLRMVWGRRDSGWELEDLCVSGVRDRKYSGVVFQYFDRNGPRVPKWIPPLLDEFWPIDEEVLTEWGVLEW
jgi:hypothetical protein